jgi:hypothetical protein
MSVVCPSLKLTSSSCTEKCVPTIDPANTCIVVKGETSILLDNNSDATFLTRLALEAIEEGLSDRTFLEGFTDDIIWAALIYSGHASLVETSNHYGDNGNGEDDPNLSPITATVAVAAASVSIVVASIFCYGFMRRTPSDDPSVRHRYRKSSPRTVISSSIGDIGIPTRRHFVRLEDLSASPTSFISASISPHRESNEYNRDDFAQEDYTPAITWSVSDITSDSASLRSGVSRTPSMLERIEEEVEEEEIGFEGVDNENTCDFSYSGDSKITVTLSEGDIRHGGYCNNDDGYRSPNDNNITDFDCRSQRQDQVLDISDLDAVFTIVADTSIMGGEDDLNYSSSHCTEESLLEIASVDMDISTDDSMVNSNETIVSDSSTVSMVALGDLTQLNSVQDSTQNLSIGQNDKDDLKFNHLDSSLSSTIGDNSVRMSNSNIEVEKEDRDSAATPISRSSSFCKDEGSSTERSKEDCTNSSSFEYISTNSNDEMKTSPIMKPNEPFGTEIQVKQSESECISNSSRCTEEDGISGTGACGDGIDVLDVDIVAVDSIDLWVSELMEVGLN